MGTARRIIIMGAGGRDFHVFNTCYRNHPQVEVVAFTAAQIPHIANRSYPPELAGARYPAGIPIRQEEDLERLIRETSADEVVFAYSDVSYEFLDGVATRVAATGADFSTFDPESSLLPSSRPCVAVCAVRTGCGKSPLARHVAARIRSLGLRPGIMRHPMPYGNLRRQIVQRFASVDDLRQQQCTIEEMEEYEPHLQEGSVVFAGADYEQILAAAEAESDVLIWDGGNNDAPFVRPSLLITLLDPLRAGHELSYFPGRWNFEHADVLVIGKMDEATDDQLQLLRANIAQHNAGATVIEGRLVIQSVGSDALRDRRVLVVEDGPTMTHGGLPHGAGYRVAERAGADIVDPRPFAVGEIAKAYASYPHIGPVLPALGYGALDVADLEHTIRRVPCDCVVVATPVDLTRVVTIHRPVVRVTYSFQEFGTATLLPRLTAVLAGNRSRRSPNE